jgi:hypothetical protein
MQRKRPSKESDLLANAWAFASVNDARAVDQTVLAKPGIISNTHDSSLDIGFFASQPVLAFLWEPIMDSTLVASVQRRAVLVGGRTSWGTHWSRNSCDKLGCGGGRCAASGLRAGRSRSTIRREGSGRMCGTNVGW